MNKIIKARNQNGEVFLTVPEWNLDKILECFAEAEATCDVFNPGMIPLAQLPADVQAEVKQVLRCYKRVTVEYEYGKFSVNAGCCIKASYNWDHFAAGDYKDEEVYTLDERRQNYFEEFGYRPCF